MPTKPRRGCATGGCPNLVDGGGVYCRECLKKRGQGTGSYGAKSDDATARHKFYEGTTWRKLRYVYIQKHPLCARCLAQGKTVPAKIVDHIVPISEGGDPYNEDNLQSLCMRCHELKSNEEGSRGFKKGKGKVYTY